MKEVILIKNGELALKGLNRRTFEDMLIANMKRRLSDLGKFHFSAAQSTIVCEGPQDVDYDEVVERLLKIFGIAGLSRAAAIEKDMDKIIEVAPEYTAPLLMAARTFKVEAKRSDKKFPFNSPQICRNVGGAILRKFPHLSVDVHNPDVIVNVEVRDKCTFIHGNQLKGAGGMPSGSAGKAALLTSGGIDSPVAGWMMAKRGVELCAVHFASPPYTSEKAELKVHELLKKVSQYSGRIVLFVVPFTEIQELIKDNCPEDVFTIVMRRLMMRISEIIANKEGCSAMITGESVGQVASQTMPAIACTDAVATMPVFRPLIGMDKDEVIAIARKIDTFETSIQPYEDCCTVFTPKHPKTRPTVAYIDECENVIDWSEPIKRAVEGAKVTVIKSY